ncbi:MAG: histidinol dehydrogenase [Actinomycetota bacterium]|nr:histidinol dehydrogenase [Actinomycetota bacterium]
MRVVKTDKEFKGFFKLLRRRAAGTDNQVLENTSKIVQAVRAKGDRALSSYTKRLDGHSKIRIGQRELEEAAAMADKTLVKALRTAAGRIRRFHEKQVHGKKTWFMEEAGIKTGQIVRPLERVGVYVPGGKASYPSSVLMNVIPAQAAGVREIAVAVPTPSGNLNPAVMAALKLLGITEAYSIGGAQAVAAFAFGTETVKKVDKIVGPGNIYVATAKRLVFGEVAIDMIAGPSEILIIADSSADPSFAAADLLSQAEHDELASSILVTDSPDFANETMRMLKGQLNALARGNIASLSLKNYGAVIIVRNLDHAAEVANQIAPEHLELMVRRPEKFVKKIRNAGAVFVGPWSAEPLGDYAAGPNHVLPTGGTARFSSPLGAYDFMKHMSYLEFTRSGLERLSGTVETMASFEGLTAHLNTVMIRRKKGLV